MPKQVIPAHIEAKITLIISQTLPGFHMWSQCQKRTYAINLLCSFAGSDILLQVSVLSSTISPWCCWHHGGSWAWVLRAAVLRTDNLVLSSLKAAGTLSLHSEGTGHKPCFISIRVNEINCPKCWYNRARSLSTQQSWNWTQHLFFFFPEDFLWEH